MKARVSPAPGRIEPSAAAQVSSVRTAVVPTAHSRPPAFRLWLTVAAASSLTAYAEAYAVSEEAAATVNQRRKAGGRLWAVGTTVVRTLETCAAADGSIRPGAGETRAFIYPPYTFRAVDRLLTNFHLPRSTLLMLVCAFGGYEHVMRAYREAIAEGYRFYSYGDAMAVT